MALRYVNELADGERKLSNIIGILNVKIEDNLRMFEEKTIKTIEFRKLLSEFGLLAPDNLLVSVNANT